MAKNLYLGNGDWATTKGSTLFYTVENGIYEGVPSEVIRNSEATTLNKDGVLETVDVDTSAIDYTNSANGALRLEDEETQRLAYTEDFTQSDWSKVRATISSSSKVFPKEGSPTMFLLESNTTGANGSWLRQYTTVNSGSEVVSTIYAAAGNSDFLAMRQSAGGVIFDLSNGTIKDSSAVDAKIELLSGDVYKCSAVFSAGNTDGEVLYYVYGSDGTLAVPNVDSGDNVYIFGANHFFTDNLNQSYVPNLTTGTSIRFADRLINVGREELFNSEEGVLHVEFSTNISNTAQGVYVSLSNDTSSNRIYTGFVSGNLIAKIQNSVDNQTLTKTGLDIKETQSVAIYYKDGDFRFYVNGVLEQSFSYSGTFLPFNRLGFDSGTGTFNFFYGSIPKLVVYKSVAEAQKDLTYIL